MCACGGLRHMNTLECSGRQVPYTPRHHVLRIFGVFLNRMSVIATEESFILN